MDPEKKKLLILGMTYPSYSRKYSENVCTGALEAETSRMVRIHPIPARYLEPEQRFKNFQWIRAHVRRHDNDPRPESLRIESSSIELCERIPPEHAEERVTLIEASPHYVQSVEEAIRRQKADGTSLAVIRPKEIIEVKMGRRSEADRKEWTEKETELLSQTRMDFVPPPRRIDFPEHRFLVTWLCDDPTCKTHTMGLGTWGLHELSRKLQRKRDADHKKKVLEKMKRDLDLEERDVFLFLGNFRTKMWNFGLMDSYSAKRNRQTNLF